MKKVLSIFICVLLCITPLSLTAFAADEVVISMPSNEISATKNNEIFISLADNINYTANSIEISFVHSKKIKLISGDFIDFGDGEKVILLDNRAASYTINSAKKISGNIFKLTVSADEVADGLTLRATVTLKNNGNVVLKKTAEVNMKAVCSEHKFGNWQILVASECETKGSRERTCSICGFKETEETEPLGHNFSDVVILREPTCLAEGYQRAFCKNCKQKLLEKIEPKGHTMGEWTTVTAPTCENNGTEQSVCSGCNITETRETAPIGHEFKDAVITQEPTIGKEGVQTGYCVRCNKSADSPVPCSHTDKETGIRMDAKKGVYPKNAKVKISLLKDNSSAHTSVAEAIAHITNQFVAYNIEVTNLGAKVSPDGEVTLTFPVPEKFGNQSVFYYITDEGSVKKLSIKTSEDGKSATFKFMGNGRYIVCKTSYATSDVFIAAASSNGTLIFIISFLFLIICWVFVALKIIKVKNPKLYSKIILSIPTKSEIRNAVKRYIFIIKETTKKPQ